MVKYAVKIPKGTEKRKEEIKERRREEARKISWFERETPSINDDDDDEKRGTFVDR